MFSRHHVALLSCVAAFASACEEDPPLKGQASRGSSALFPDAGAPVPTKRISLDPGGPLAASRVVDIARKRIAKLGLSGGAVKIGAYGVDIDVAEKRLAEVSKALEGGRFDMYLFDESQEPFRRSEELDGIVLKDEKVVVDEGEPRAVSYAVGERDVLLKIVEATETPSLGLIGPVDVDGKELYRSYFVELERDTRGEYIASAEAVEDAGAAYLVLTFNGGAVNMLRWSSKRKRRLVARIDGEVVATTQTEALIKDGTVRFELGDIESAKTIATSINGVGFSHKVKRIEKK